MDKITFRGIDYPIRIVGIEVIGNEFDSPDLIKSL